MCTVNLVFLVVAVSCSIGNQLYTAIVHNETVMKQNLTTSWEYMDIVSTEGKATIVLRVLKEACVVGSDRRFLE